MEQGECQAVCQQSISIDTIARMRHDWLRASLQAQRLDGVGNG